jgi:hypothetical protein
MANEFLTIEGRRECYALSQIRFVGEPLTVSQLIEVLEEYPSDMPVVLNNDNGYTYGTITQSSFEVEEMDEDEDEDEDE